MTSVTRRMRRTRRSLTKIYQKGCTRRLKFDTETTHGLLAEFCLQITNLCRYFIAETRVVSQIHRNLLANKFENKWYTVSCPRDEQHGQVVHEVE